MTKKPAKKLSQRRSSLEKSPQKDHPSTAHLTDLVRQRMKLSRATTEMGFQVDLVEKARAVFSLDLEPRHKQIHGVVHGGILAALADTASAIAAYTTIPEGAEIATLELKINYLQPVSGGRITAEARVLRTGRNFVVTECEIRDSKGGLAAKALLTFAATAGHSLQQA
ncbi:MAG TPA: PaaI family thioesterase [Candidatus Dormibacteraeota bacterium]|nr:PaaI family thioesterase [Candidatus Dormibacteraeota bacterium]